MGIRKSLGALYHREPQPADVWRIRPVGGHCFCAGRCLTQAGMLADTGSPPSCTGTGYRSGWCLGAERTGPLAVIASAYGECAVPR